ncbi:MAG TPA: hypothetical protein PLX89_00300 [Verrucomicrobiota bacterium]|nr:hypothetical protein [Verrucomicrobiota bacterium]
MATRAEAREAWHPRFGIRLAHKIGLVLRIEFLGGSDGPNGEQQGGNYREQERGSSFHLLASLWD